MSPPDWVRPVGLDVEVLRGIRGPSTTTAALLTRIEEHLERWQGYVAFSGGKDSLVVLDLARRVEPQVPVVFFDSGLEYPQTYPYLEDLAARWRLNLRIIDADPPLLTLLTHGGRWDHHAPIRDAGAGTIQDALISRPAAAAHNDHGPGEVWGVRGGESAGRRIAYAKALAGLHCGCCATPGQRRDRHGGVLHRLRGFHGGADRGHRRVRADLGLAHPGGVGAHRPRATAPQPRLWHLAPHRRPGGRAADLPPHRRRPPRERTADLVTAWMARPLRRTRHLAPQDPRIRLTSAPLSPERLHGAR